MKKSTLSFVLLLMLVPVFIFSQQGNFQQQNIWYRNFSLLNLSAEQKEKIDNLQKDFFEKMVLINSDIDAKYFELRRLMTDPSVDEKKIRSKQQEISDLEQKHRSISLDYQLKVKEILTADQLAVLSQRGGLGLGLYSGIGFGRGFGRGFGYMRGDPRGLRINSSQGFGFYRAGVGRGINAYAGRGRGRGFGMRNRMNFCLWRR